ncbi:MAG: nicotinate-nucleotide--dimethylbenzimidazole phosphoribosyltransferase [Rectinemataceae bacterium]
MGLFEDTVKVIGPADREAMLQASTRQDGLAKPIGSLGTLETISIRIAGVTGKTKNELKRKCVIVMAADNGIYEEGVSACPQMVTLAQSINSLNGVTGIAVLGRFGGADLRVVDMGIDCEGSFPGLIDRKIRKGTYNIAERAAMTRDEAVSAIETGIKLVSELAEEGYELLGTGELGICNTSTSSAVLMGLTGTDADIAVGKGTGLSDEGFANKKNVIKRALALNRPVRQDPVDVLAKVGGFDIAGLVGCYLGAAYCRLPIVIDGFISAVAALAATRIAPLVGDYLFPSHCSEEPGFMVTMKELGLEPILNLHMRLGEGTGCPLAFNVIEAAVTLLNEMATFEEAGIASKSYIENRIR